MPLKRVFRFFLLTLSRAIHCMLSFGPCCRFVPSCSEYSAQAFARHGALGGVLLTLHRLLRCHPFGASGWDPVPNRWGIRNGR